MIIKLYFKKIFSALLLFLTTLSALFVSFYVCYIITHSLEIGGLLTRTISIIATSVFNLILLYRFRLKNSVNREKYLSVFDGKFIFKKDIVLTLKSKDYIAETLALLTLDLPLFLYAGIAIKTPFFPLVIGTLLLIIISVVSFSIIDITLWLLVHKRWAYENTYNRV